MYVIDQSILDDAVAMDVSWDLAQRNIDVAIAQEDALREMYRSDRANLRRLANRALAIEYGRSETIALLDEIQRTVVSMHQSAADYEIVDNKLNRAWQQVHKVKGEQVEWERVLIEDEDFRQQMTDRERRDAYGD